MKDQKGTSHSPQVSRLKRVEGQVRGVIKMIEDERYCIDILTQIKAIKSALSSVENKIIDQHLTHCVHTAIKSKNLDKSSEMLDEIRSLLKSIKV